MQEQWQCFKKWFKNKWHTISAFVGCVIISVILRSWKFKIPSKIPETLYIYTHTHTRTHNFQILRINCWHFDSKFLFGWYFASKVRYCADKPRHEDRQVVASSMHSRPWNKRPFLWTSLPSPGEKAPNPTGQQTVSHCWLSYAGSLLHS